MLVFCALLTEKHSCYIVLSQMGPPNLGAGYFNNELMPPTNGVESFVQLATLYHRKI